MTKEIEFFNIATMPEILELDVLFSSEYGKLCNLSGDGIWELCQYKDLIYVYMKRPYTFDTLTYYDLISPYGYNGFYYEKVETFKEFIPLFRNIAKNRNFITEVVRQAPYFNLDTSIIDEVYGIITDRRIFSVKILFFLFPNIGFRPVQFVG